MTRLHCLVLVVMIIALSLSSAEAGERKEIRKAFEGVKSVKLEGVSGDCVVETHSSGEAVVVLTYDVSPEDAFEAKFKKSGSTLRLEEKWKGCSTSEVLWKITLPAEVKFDFSTASGDLIVTGLMNSVEASTASGDIEIRDVKGDIGVSVASGDIILENIVGEVDASTASGDIDLSGIEGECDISTASGDIEGENLNGDLEISSASGEIEISGCKGAFDISCASGDIEADKVELTDISSFTTASGNVDVLLSETAVFDLKLSTASGNAALVYDGNPVRGYFEMSAKKRGGNIKCPFKFDDEEEYERNGRKYVRKSFTKEEDSPEITISTASGTAVLKE